MRRVRIAYRDQSAQLKEIRAADPDGQGRHSFTAQQQTLRRLNVGYPRFKPYQRFDQVLFAAGDGAKWDPAVDGRWAHASFQAVGRVKVKQHRQVVGRVKTLQLKREGRRWYVIVVTDANPQPLPATRRQVGVDVGVARFMTTSDGEVIGNPRFLDAAQARISGCSGGRNAPRPARAIVGGCAASWPASGARSATVGRTSTTRPLAVWSTPVTRLCWRTCTSVA